MCNGCKLAGIGAKRKKAIGNKEGASTITETLTAVALSAGGAIAAQELTAMVPEETIPHEYVDMGKLVLPLVVPMLGINEPMVDKFLEGMAVQGALSLFAKYVTNKPAATTTTATSTTTARMIAGNIQAHTAALNGNYGYGIKNPVLNGLNATQPVTA